jgi:hypothetical protein
MPWTQVCPPELLFWYRMQMMCTSAISIQSKTSTGTGISTHEYRNGGEGQPRVEGREGTSEEGRRIAFEIYS